MDRVAAHALLCRALEQGINYFDTTYLYHDGKSEEIMAKVLSLHPREGYYLADKFPVWLAKTPEAVERIFCEQLEDNLFTMTPFAPLSPEESSALDRALAAYLSAGTIPCTGCRYCMDCPFGVDIPRHFALYNQYRLDGRASHFTNT